MKWNEFDLLCCSSCGLVFADPIEVPRSLYENVYETPGEYGNFYEGYYSEAEKVSGRKFHVAWAWRHFFRLNCRKGRLVDIGCSTGVFMVAARDRGWHTVGVEFSSRAAEIARKTTESEIFAGTIEECNFPPGSFDAVTSWEVLEHLPDPATFFRSIYRILKPGGVWALSTPNWRSRWERSTTEMTRRPPFHLTYWTPASLRKMLVSGGFTEILIREKPFAWQEEMGRMKWVCLPISLFRSFILGQKGNRLLAIARKPMEGKQL